MNHFGVLEIALTELRYAMLGVYLAFSRMATLKTTFACNILLDSKELAPFVDFPQQTSPVSLTAQTSNRVLLELQVSYIFDFPACSSPPFDKV